MSTYTHESSDSYQNRNDRRAYHTYPDESSDSYQNRNNRRAYHRANPYYKHHMAYEQARQHQIARNLELALIAMDRNPIYQQYEELRAERDRLWHQLNATDPSAATRFQRPRNDNYS